ncbi:high mobility group box domain-containing protein [Phycomyces blakesleeanus]|uniref:HMG box domain-containing protein n=2 Tax=Phycomyces blakesleeanus TaxID=4837 RepID=A0A167JIS0_PHYB8|nr:hypothetical protein PHYBLDRAFT_152852 [Phycomyces blakesleeanus NRRL 1555(-)]OAD66048.1 hypothetical protein PHYBLDRAFT_152852 [Phycomyces blakesleeanus NRRL 1555(-)]|eukprot:XP_018284088.1 hypothetical protein PHYBLDRAFT_152852 [Phycomyces blakesleeanus NRRL 1555(-)]
MADSSSQSTSHTKPKSARKKGVTSTRQYESWTGRPSPSPDPPGSPHGQPPARRRRRLGDFDQIYRAFAAFESTLKQVDIRAILGRPIRRRQRRRPRDPNLPKRNAHSYAHFTKTNYAIVKADIPNINQRDVFRTLGQRWRALSAEDKERYVTMAQNDRVRYLREMEEYRRRFPNP